MPTDPVISTNPVKNSLTMNQTKMTPAEIASILTSVKTIALVGASNKPGRDSYQVHKYMREKGYKIIPVNPKLQGRTILGARVAGSLKRLRTGIDMVDIFRKSEHVSNVMADIQMMDPLPKVIWMQLGVKDLKVARRARKMGIRVVMNKCPKIEYEKLRKREKRNANAVRGR